MAIAGATDASYATSAVALGDSGTGFQVTVSNASSSATSNSATLTAGPRAPALGDLRYLLCQQVTAPGYCVGDTLIVNSLVYSATNSLGTPYQMGSTAITTGGCAWLGSVWPLPTGMTGLNMYYQYDNPDDTPYPAYLESVATPNVVINSIDLEPLCGFVASWVQTTGTGGFDFKMESVPPSQLQATVAADGAASRIVTATTFDDSTGNAVLISYGWQGDTTTTYEAQTVIATPANVASAATTLAGEGYFISAFGGNDTDGYMLIGMRVQGDTLARPIAVGAPASPETVPYSIVVWFSETAGQYGTQLGEL